MVLVYLFEVELCTAQRPFSIRSARRRRWTGLVRSYRSRYRHSLRGAPSWRSSRSFSATTQTEVPSVEVKVSPSLRSVMVTFFMVPVYPFEEELCTMGELCFAKKSGTGRGHPSRQGLLGLREGSLVEEQTFLTFDPVELVQGRVELFVRDENVALDVARHVAHLGERGVDEGTLERRGVVHGLTLPWPNQLCTTFRK